MKKQHVALSLLVAFMAVSCTRKMTDGFTETIPVYADSISVNEIINPYAFVSVDDHILITGGTKDSLVYVYECPDFKFKYSALHVGEGPGEYPTKWINIEPRTYGGCVAVHDYSRDLMHMYTIADTVLSHESTVYMNVKDRPVHEKEYDFPDPYYVEAKGLGTDDMCFALYDINTGSVKDSITDIYYYVEKDENVIAGINHPSVFVKGNEMAMLYPHGRYEFYDIKNGKITPVATLGDDRTLSEIRKEYSLRNQPIHSAAQYGDYVYILDRTGGKGNTLLVYDYDGRPIKKYALDKTLTMFGIGDGKLFGTNWKRDFTHVYVYDLGL